jgi:Domain of unknown function (DUF4172)/Lrp/AsnC ligand binding domain/Fic/DOC family
MRWNWQLPDWPDFRFDAERIRASEEQFLKGSGVVIGALHHLDPDARDGLTIELISQEVVDSSAIEGEILDRDSVQSSLARHLGFATDQRRANAAEAGAAELMADVYRNHAAPLNDQTLFAWHAMLMNGRRDIADVGRYRTHEDAMQIVSGALHAPHVHYEAPPSDTVPMEMSRFIAWFNDSAPASANPLPAITPSITARIDKLKDAGAITGYTVVVDPGAFGLNVAAFVRMNAMPGQMNKLIQMVKDTPEIVETFHITGKECLQAKMVVCDMQTLEAVVDRFGSCASTETSVIQSVTVAQRLPKL